MRKTVIMMILISIISLTNCGIRLENNESIDETSHKMTNMSIYGVGTKNQNSNIRNPHLLMSGSQEEMVYEITSKIFNDKNITISYPEISTICGNKNTIVNHLILDEVLKIATYFYPDYNELNLEVDYEIKRADSKLISIAYTGVGFIQGVPYPKNIFYTTNINIETGERIELNDVIYVSESFVELIRSESVTYLIPEQESVVNNIADYDLIRMLQYADKTDITETEFQSQTFTYFTNDSLGISIEVMHVAGDHAVIEIHYEKCNERGHSAAARTP